MEIKFKVKRILVPFCYKDITLYPVEIYINEPYGYTVNALEEIPQSTKYVSAELKSFGKALKLGHIKPIKE